MINLNEGEKEHQIQPRHVLSYQLLGLVEVYGPACPNKRLIADVLADARKVEDGRNSKRA